MNKHELLAALENVEQISRCSKFRRMLNHPIKYLYSLLYRELIYPISQKEIVVSTIPFFNQKMKIALPASSDIYLTGGKSHSSEIRLAKFLIQYLNENAHFLDIGAHVGYFTLLASIVVGKDGRVVAFEPSEKSFKLLLSNTSIFQQITVYQKVVSSSSSPITFYEFPTLYSEYNTSDIHPHEHEDWFKRTKYKKVEVAAETLDEFLIHHSFQPAFIKIDVEGAEYDVVLGGKQFFTLYSPTIMMEYVEPKRDNHSHKQARDLLYELGYQSFLILDDGSIKTITDIDSYLEKNHLESDNIVFRK
jgi:methyltransferase, FkbM family